MILIDNIYNKSCMFKNCELLESLSILSINSDKKDHKSIEKIFDNEYNLEIIESEKNEN